MTSSLIRVLLAVAATGALSCGYAQQASKLTSRNLALEVPAGSMVLPLDAKSAAVFPPCGGCVPKSFPATPSTAYYLRSTPVSVSELKSAITARPELILTVLYSLETGELVSVTADIDAPRPAKRHAP